MMYKEKWGHLSEEDQVYVQIHIRITKDGALEADIFKVFEVQPVRVALVEFYVLPGMVTNSLFHIAPSLLYFPKVLATIR